MRTSCASADLHELNAAELGEAVLSNLKISMTLPNPQNVPSTPQIQAAPHKYPHLHTHAAGLSDVGGGEVRRLRLREGPALPEVYPVEAHPEEPDRGPPRVCNGPVQYPYSVVPCDLMLKQAERTERLRRLN